MEAFLFATDRRRMEAFATDRRRMEAFSQIIERMEASSILFHHALGWLSED